MSKSILLRFGNPRYLPSEVDGIFIYFPYELIVKNKEKYKLDVIEGSSKGIRVAISGSLAITWGFQIWQPEVNYNNLKKLLFMYCLELIKKKYLDGTLKDYEEIGLTTQNHPAGIIYDVTQIPEVYGYEEELNFADQPSIDHEYSIEIEIGSAIVQNRDSINAIFYSLFREKLFLSDQERNVLDILKPVKTKDEFISHLASLGGLVGNVNINLLKRIVPEENHVQGSINLLGKYIEQIGGKSDEIIVSMKHIVRMRQSYPVHTDKADGVLASYDYFNIEYPITNYEKAWKSLLNAYLNSTTNLIELIKVIK